MTHVCSWWKGPWRLSAPPPTTPPHTLLPPWHWPGTSSQTAHSADVWWFQKGKGSQVTSVNSLLSPLRITPVALPIKAKFRALTTPWPHGLPSLSSLPQWASSTYKPNKHFPVSATFAPEKLEASGLRVQSWLGHAPAICAVTRPPLHLPPRAALRGTGTRGRGDQRAQIWHQGRTGWGRRSVEVQGGPQQWLSQSNLQWFCNSEAEQDMSSRILKTFYAKWLVKLHDDLRICCCSIAKSYLFSTPWTVAHLVSLSFTISQSLLKLMSIESVMPSDHLILCRPLVLLPSIFSSIRVIYVLSFLTASDWIRGKSHRGNMIWGTSWSLFVSCFLWCFSTSHPPRPWAMSLHLLWQQSIQVTPDTKDPVSEEDHVHGFQDKN